MTATTVGATPPETRNPHLMLLGCCLALFIISLDATIVNVALPAIQADLHASVSGLQWIIDSYTLVLACLLLLAGSTGDRIGRRRDVPGRPGHFRRRLAALLCGAEPRHARRRSGYSRPLGAPCSSRTPCRPSPTSSPTRHGGPTPSACGLACSAPPRRPARHRRVLVDHDRVAAHFLGQPSRRRARVRARRPLRPETARSPPRRADLPGQASPPPHARRRSPTRSSRARPAAGHRRRSPALFAVAVLGLVRLPARPSVIAMNHCWNCGSSEARRSPARPRMATLAFAILAGFLFLNTLYLQEVRGDSALYGRDRHPSRHCRHRRRLPPSPAASLRPPAAACR